MADNATRSPERVYAERFVFLIAIVVLASFMQGARAALVCAISVAAAMLSDALCCTLRKQRYDPKDSSVLFWGLCTGAMMPISAPVWAAAMSAVICITVGKHSRSNAYRTDDRGSDALHK